MFEISLVPEVKAKLLRQERIRNLVIFICIIVAAGCGVLIAALVSADLALKAKSKGLNAEIACRIDSNSEKAKNCKNSGLAIMQTDNLNEMLSIQNELNNIGAINAGKTKPSRLLPSTDQLTFEKEGTIQAFSMLEIALPSDAEYKFQTSEFEIDFEESVMHYDVVAHAVNTSAQATAYINYKYSINGSYYDYGDYVRVDEDGNEVVIPTYCIAGEEIINNEVYGIYNRYAAGCEAPMTNKASNNTDNSGEGGENKSNESTYHPVDRIYIRRSYKSVEDFEKYQAGEGRSSDGKVIAEGEAPKGFFFRSNCMNYNENGEFDEAATLAACPVATETVEGTDKAEGRDETTGLKVMTFSVELPFSEDIFKQSSHNVLFFYPSRKTVSTSYTAISDFFTKPVDNTNPVEDK